MTTTESVGWLLRGQSLLGLLVFLALTYGLGLLVNRRRFAVPWRVVGFGMGLQLAFAALILKTPWGRAVFEGLNGVVKLLLAASQEGAALIFGNLARGNNVPVGPPLDPSDPAFSPLALGAGGAAQSLGGVGAFFAFNVLPTIIFFSALLSVLYYSGAMKWVVGGLAWVMRRTMGTSGAETLSAAANVFVGQTEAPLFVRPFLATMTRSELHAVMVGGFANIASGVLGVYTGLLSAKALGGAAISDAGSHLLAASVISAPAGLVVAKLLLPETGTPETADAGRVEVGTSDANLLDAAVRGTRDGLLLAANVGAVLIVFAGFVYLVNSGLGAFSTWAGSGTPVTLQMVLGYVMWPVAWLCGAPPAHCREIGSLIGIKTALNEFFGYLQMKDGLSNQAATGEPYMTRRSQLIALYAICGFANFASVGIQIGGIGVLAPSRRAELARIGLLAMVGGTVASLLTACVVGMIL